ncbi:DNA polymerase III PolC-type-like isoform X1 [Ostrea edulis]|uniref:DNA polymerase III PolC-type-like isoform X1 n=1 Tax=Ostrea edulis TaxID=37623 RepID=UPI0024AEBCFE|nr:DNA polymerase III PolC-type-like isoform X1 [Ostrea edulis]
MKFSNKVDEYRVKRREKMKLPGTKRRRLILKQERAMQMNASEASEGSTYQSEIGLGTEADIEQIPNPIPKPNFGAVQKLKNMEAKYIIFDLETTGLIRQGAMPHITQIGAVEIESGNVFSTYVQPKIPIEPGAEETTGIVCDGTSVFAHGSKVTAVPICEAILNFLKWLGTFGKYGIILVAHNVRVFDFRVLSHAIDCIGLQEDFLEIVSGFTDSLSLIRSKHKKLEKYSQIFLAKHFCNETYSAHDAVEDVKMLSKILSVAVSQSELSKAAYDAETPFLQDKFNSAKTLYLPSLNILVGNGVMKMNMAENVAGSGLGLHHLKLIHKRSGEDGLRNIFCAQTSRGKPRVTSDCKVLDYVVPKLCQFFSQ